MPLDELIIKVNHLEKEKRVVAIAMLLNLYEEKRENEVFDILFKRYLLEDDAEVLDILANALKEINPLKVAVSIQELYEKENQSFRKIALVDLLINIKAPEIEEYILLLLAHEKNTRVSHYIKSVIKKFQKSLIDSQNLESLIVYWKEIEFDDTYEDKCCMICKLHFAKFDGIVSCSVCHSLFHTEHLLDWLAEKKHCPVCNRKVVDIGLKKYR
jgi:hypothetical protein